MSVNTGPGPAMFLQALESSLCSGRGDSEFILVVLYLMQDV